MENGFYRRLSRHHDAAARARLDGLGSALPDGDRARSHQGDHVGQSDDLLGGAAQSHARPAQRLPRRRVEPRGDRRLRYRAAPGQRRPGSANIHALRRMMSLPCGIRLRLVHPSEARTPCLFLLLLLLLSACIPVKPLPVLGQVPQFQTHKQTGQPFDSHSLDGHIWVANFIFTTCTGPCPMMSHQMRGIQNSTHASPELKLVSFTVDPDRRPYLGGQLHLHHLHRPLPHDESPDARHPEFHPCLARIEARQLHRRSRPRHPARARQIRRPLQGGPRTLVFPDRRNGAPQRSRPQRLQVEQRGWRPQPQYALRPGGWPSPHPRLLSLQRRRLSREAPPRHPPTAKRALMISLLPSVNATLNALSAVLLVWGYLLIRRRQIDQHRRVMKTAFATSCLFLVCYLVYHAQVGSVPFHHGAASRPG